MLVHFLLQLSCIVPTAPRDLTVEYLSSTSLEVTWTHPQCDYGIRTGYTAYPDHTHKIAPYLLVGPQCSAYP